MSMAWTLAQCVERPGQIPEYTPSIGKKEKVVKKDQLELNIGKKKEINTIQRESNETENKVTSEKINQILAWEMC